MADIVRLGSKDDDLLMDFLGRTAEATVFHTPEWRDAVVASYGYRPEYLASIEGGRITALLPLMLVRSWLTGTRLVSVPFANICGPIGVGSQVPDLLDRAVSLLAETKAKALEIRTQAGLNNFDDPRFASVSFFVTSIMDLDSDPQKIWKAFPSGGIRTEVRQAEKRGLTAERAASLEDLAQFYSLFAKLRLKFGVPPQPYAFFLNLWKHLGPDHSKLFVAKHDGRTVGGLFSLGFGATLCGSYIGSDPAYKPSRVHQILYWKTIEAACLEGYKMFDFLRTAKKDEGIRFFKQRWNAREVDLDYRYYPEVRGTAATVEETGKYALLTGILKHAPFSVGKAVGKIIYKHTG